MELRPYQSNAVDRIRDAIRQGKRSILLVAPTGSGKTVCAASILKGVEQKGKSAIFVAHRRELIKQCSNKLKDFDIPHAIFMAGERPSLMTEIQVCSIQTFHSRVTKNKRINPPSADVVIIDESHRALAKSYLALKVAYPNAIFIGLTATPCRADGAGLGNFYEELVEVSNPKELIELNFLVPARIVAPRLPDLRGLKLRQGDYEQGELGNRMNLMVGDLLSDWEQHAKDRKTVIFAVTVAHSQHIQELFFNAGYACEHLDGETPVERRDEILSNLKSGTTQIVVNCQVLSEGWDEPSVSCVVLARPTKSYGLYLQMSGRALRPFEGKKDCIIIDHAGAVYEHGFPQDAGGWFLEEGFNINTVKNERLKKEPHPVTCRECFTVYTIERFCPNCGCKPTEQAKAISMHEGRLYEVKRQEEIRERDEILARPRNASVKDKADFYGQLKTIAYKHGYKNGWVAHKYKERFGVWPNLNEIKQAPMREPLPETLNFIKHHQIRFAKSRKAFVYNQGL